MRTLRAGLRAWGAGRLLSGLLALKLVLSWWAARAAATAWTAVIDGSVALGEPSALPRLDWIRVAGATRRPLLESFADGGAVAFGVYAVLLALVGGGLLTSLSRGRYDGFRHECARCAPVFLVLLGLEVALAAAVLRAAGALEVPIERAIANSKDADLVLALPALRVLVSAAVLGLVALYTGLARAHFAAVGRGFLAALRGAARAFLATPVQLAVLVLVSLLLWCSAAAGFYAFAAIRFGMSPVLGPIALTGLAAIQVASRLFLWGGELSIVTRGTKSVAPARTRSDRLAALAEETS